MKEKYEKEFIEAIESVIRHEGVYANDKEDRGGQTKYGISKRMYPNLDIENLSMEEAIKIYYEDYWKLERYKEINHNEVMIKLFDLGINMGCYMAYCLIQRALRATGKEVIEDGIMGPKTIKAINEAEGKILLASLKSEAAGYYRIIACRNESQKKYIEGWLNRAYS